MHNPSQTADFAIPHETSTDIVVKRASFEPRNGYYVLGFHLLLNGRWSMAFERAKVNGSLVDELDSTISGPNSQRLDAGDLMIIRTLIERCFLYDLQALEANHYWVNPE
jgi:hypothetical protein